MTAVQMPTLKAQNRVAAGKAEARRLRRTGFVPAVAYGKGLPATSIAVTPKEVAIILKSERGQNTVVELELEDKKILAMIRDFVLHPVKRSLEHIDFIEVKLDKPVDVNVPLFATGKAVGVTAGGVLRIVYRTVPVRCLPDRIPVKLETDVTHLELGMHVSTQELKLPEGVSVLLPPEQTLVAVVAPEKEEVVEVVPGAPGTVAAAGAAVPGAPGAAAAGGAAPAAEAAPAKEEKKKNEAMLLVVGLGNPGREHEGQRHNVGFMVLDALRSAEGWPEYREKHSGLCTRGELGGQPVVLLEPQTYMNLSGDSVQPAAAFLKAAPADIVVVHDELDLPWKDLRIKVGGGHAGHNGLRSIMQRLGTPEFARVRVGIGRPPPGFVGSGADWVLSRFDPVEKAELGDVVGRAVDAVRRIAKDGLAPAMKHVNTGVVATKG